MNLSYTAMRRNKTLLSKVAVPRISNVNPTRCIRGNKLNSDGFCLDIAFISQIVYVVPTGIQKSHPCLVHMRLAVGIVSFIVRHRARGDDDQAMPGVRMPAGASPGRPNIALHVHV